MYFIYLFFSYMSVDVYKGQQCIPFISSFSSKTWIYQTFETFWMCVKSSLWILF